MQSHLGRIMYSTTYSAVVLKDNCFTVRVKRHKNNMMADCRKCVLLFIRNNNILMLSWDPQQLKKVFCTFLLKPEG